MHDVCMAVLTAVRGFVVLCAVLLQPEPQRFESGRVGLERPCTTCTTEDGDRLNTNIHANILYIQE
jgi:hypothetical protein